MNNRRPGGNRRPDRSHGATPYNKPPARKYIAGKPGARPFGVKSQQAPAGNTNIVIDVGAWPDSANSAGLAETSTPAQTSQKRPQGGPFRVLIAVHRPRYRGRAERAAAMPGWEIVSLVNKQDAVGQVQKGDDPPDLVVLSSDFGRQKSFGIFRAIQSYRARGMKIVCLAETCEADEAGIQPLDLCDVCLPPPYTAADLRVLFCRLYEQIRGQPVPTGGNVHLVEKTMEDDE